MTMSKHNGVGVLTYHNGPNFGGFMQAWHLVHAIRACGYDAHAVNYLHPAHHESNQIRIPFRGLGSLKARVFWELKKRGFRNIEPLLCKHPFTTDPASVPWDDFEALVVGSDIVWDYENPAFGHDPAYFGMLPELEGKPIMAYAASCGPANPEGPFPDYVAKGLSRFVALGVRDHATERLVSNASGRECSLVVDPTWLGDDPDPEWSDAPKGRYLFAYGGRFDDSLGPMLRDYCRARGLRLVSALTSCRWADKMYRWLTPFQWAYLFKNAETTAIVGTLHGTLFSMKYGKPFVLVNSAAISPKIAQVLERTGQTFRVFQPGTIRAEDLKMLDAGEAPPPAIPVDWKEESLAFLRQGLQTADQARLQPTSEP
jgi:hypothetical protein